MSGARGRAPVLLSGYYGAGNLGDEALLSGLLSVLVGAGHRPVVASLDPRATRRDHGVAAVHRYRGLPAALLAAGAVVSGGGGLLQDVTSARSLRYYLGVVQAARALRRPVAVFAQSLGPLSAAGAARVAAALRDVPLGLRDAPSLDLAARLGLRGRAVADTALLLPRPARAPADGDPALVLVPRAGYPGVRAVLAALGRRHAARGGALRIALVDPGRDTEEGAALAVALPSARLVRATTVEALLGALAGAEAVISGRLHGLVLGAVAGAPVAGLAYDPKVAGFADAIGAPWTAVPDAADAGAIAAAVAALAPFLATPRLDTAAVDRATARAREGVAWLLRDALGLDA